MDETTSTPVTQAQGQAATPARGHGFAPRPTRRLYCSLGILGSVAVLSVILLSVIAYSTMVSGKQLIVQQALLQGYWMARALEMSHRVATDSHERVLRQIVQDLKTHASVRAIVLLDERYQVLLASDPTREGTIWAPPFDAPPEHGTVVRRVDDLVDVAFPTAFTHTLLGAHAHPAGSDVFQQARWVLLQLEMTAAYEHYRGMVTQKVLLALMVLLGGIAALFLLGVVQQYALAHDSIAHLEHIKRQLGRFVPGTVQRLIESNPETPLFDKVERQATILFLDIEQYSKLTETLPPERMNGLVERYFSAFLETILVCGGEINETAGDGLMAIFTANQWRTHAINATRAAVTIRDQAQQLNAARTPEEPAILVNIGLCTGSVLLGATRMRSSTQDRLTYTASGMVTNIAARLCALANGGEIYLSETTAELGKPHFTLLGPRVAQLKNLSTEVTMYTLVSEGSAQYASHSAGGTMPAT